MSNRDFSEKNMPIVKLSDIKRMVTSIERDTKNEDPELSLEFILVALFPNCWNNIKTEMNRQYTLGHIDGKKEAGTINAIYGGYGEDVDCYCE